MKTTTSQKNPTNAFASTACFPKRQCRFAMSAIALSVIATFMLSGVARAASGTWSTAVSGTWGDTTKWNSATLADGADNIADFSIVNGNTVSFDAAHTIGYLIFGNNNATIGNTVASGTTLTLRTTFLGTTPTITVGGGTTIINTALPGTQGFIKNGAGALTLQQNADVWSPTGNNIF